MHTLSFSAVFCQKGTGSRDGTTALLAPASLINHPCWELGAISNTGPEGYAQLWPVHPHPRSACQQEAPIPPPPLHAPLSVPLRWAARSSAPSPGPQAGQKSRWLFFPHIPDTNSSFYSLSGRNHSKTAVCCACESSVVSNSLWPPGPGSSVREILQARILEWVGISFSRGSSRPRDQTWASGIADRCFPVWAAREALRQQQ